MITLEDCLVFCGLDEAEVLALAEHEHIPEAAAAGLAQYLLRKPHGAERIRDMIIEDILAARERGDAEHARDLAVVLGHFLDTHPQARTSPLGETGATSA